MTNRTLPKASWVYISFAILFVVLVLLMPRTAKFGYEYRKGAPWKHETLIAQVDFPVLSSKGEKGESIVSSETKASPYFRYSSEAVHTSLDAVQKLDFKGGAEKARKPLLGILESIYAKGIVNDDKALASAGNSVIHVQKGKSAYKVPSSEVYTRSSARTAIVSELRTSVTRIDADSLVSAVKLFDVIVPNLLFDKNLTDLVQAESSTEESATVGYISAGQRIVSSGELVTPEIAQLLDSYKAEYESTIGYGRPRFFLWLGNALVSFVLLLLLFFSIWLSNPDIFQQKRKVHYIMFVFLLFVSASLLVSHLGSRYLLLLPFSACALFLNAFFRNKVVVPVYIVTLLPVLFTSEMGVPIFFTHLVCGFVFCYSFQSFDRSWKQFLPSGIAFLFGACSLLGFYLLNITTGNIFKALGALLVSCLVSVVAFQLVFVLERMFGLVSITRLEELANTSNPLLRTLNEKAPGTYQHCIGVMGMAEACARAIDASVPMVRVGALYHDIGKVSNPTCFIENQSLLSTDDTVGFHSDLTPEQSAKFIIAHVTDGLEMAREAHLPSVVSDFIVTHHGTGCVSYFYSKFVNAGGDESQRPEFCYPGRKPRTKEQVILMLCDSVEAASRTIKARTPEAFAEFIEGIVAGKQADGQLVDADISIKELGILKEVLKNYLLQFYHKRIAYPKNNNK